MPIRLPLKVSISPKAMSTEWWISASGGHIKPATSKRHPNAQSITAHMSWRRFITCDCYVPRMRLEDNAWQLTRGKLKRQLIQLLRAPYNWTFERCEIRTCACSGIWRWNKNYPKLTQNSRFREVQCSSVVKNITAERMFFRGGRTDHGRARKRGMW